MMYYFGVLKCCFLDTESFKLTNGRFKKGAKKIAFGVKEVMRKGLKKGF